MNQYLKNLSKIEFVVTNACTGHCRHCSGGGHVADSERIDPSLAAEAVKKIASEYMIKTVMAFGGEPLLHEDAVYAIISAAKDLGIEKRQVITNGYFSSDIEKISETVRRLALCGVNDLLLSVDAFHQETIPLETVKLFAMEAKKCGIPIRLSPAWLVSKEDDNPYNRKTREVLASFFDADIPVGEGNVVFFEGNAKIYLSEYFSGKLPENPYVENPHDVRCVSFSPNGDVLDGNIYRSDIMNILKDYGKV